jgi:hypothetical protein
VVSHRSKLHMKAFLCCLVLAAFALRAHARIGDTESQLVARFGKPVSQEGGLNGSLRFAFAEWLVTCDMVDGLCGRISYSKVGEWTEEVFDKLLLANGRASEWTDLTSPNVKKLQRKWKRADGAIAQWVTGCLLITSPRYEKAQAVADSEALVAATNT